MEIEQKIAIEAKKLSEYYANYYVKKYPRQKQTIINKFLPIFNKAANMFCIREGYDAKKLIDVFMMNGFKYPNQILNEYFWKEYEKAYLYVKEENEDKQIVEEIVNSILQIKKYRTVSDWLDNVSNQLNIKSNKSQLVTLLVFSGSFENFYANNSFKYNISFMAERFRVMNSRYSSKIMPKIISFLGDDYYKTDHSKEWWYKEMDKLNFVF